MVYLARKDGKVVFHTDRQAMMDIDGVTPEREITNKAFEAAGGLARIIGGEIFIGKTTAEKAAEENELKIVILKRKLAETDYVAAKIAEGSATKAEYADVIAQRQAWRQEIRNLQMAEA